MSQEVVAPQHRFLQTITDATHNPYELFKTRLLQTYAPVDTALLSQLLAAVELGDRRPTDMMNTMLSQLPPDEPAGKLFLALYLQRLPAPLRERVGAKHFTDPQQLAENGDTLWEAQPRPPITAAVLPAAQLPRRTLRTAAVPRAAPLLGLTLMACHPATGFPQAFSRRLRPPVLPLLTSVTTTSSLGRWPATASCPVPGQKTTGPPEATSHSARRQPAPSVARHHLCCGLPCGIWIQFQPAASSFTRSPIWPSTPHR